MPKFCWKVYHDLALVSEAVSKYAQKAMDWIELAEAISKSFSAEESSVELKGKVYKERTIC